MKKNILLTGRPGSGKSTLIHKVVERLKASGLKEMGGFYTLEVREGRGLKKVGGAGRASP